MAGLDLAKKPVALRPQIVHLFAMKSNNIAQPVEFCFQSSVGDGQLSSSVQPFHRNGGGCLLYHGGFRERFQRNRRIDSMQLGRLDLVAAVIASSG